MPPLEPYFTAQYVADLLCVERQQVYRWRARGRLRVVRLGPGGKRIRIPESSVIEFLGLGDQPEKPSPETPRPRVETVTDGPARLREARMFFKRAGLGRGFGR